MAKIIPCIFRIMAVRERHLWRRCALVLVPATGPAQTLPRTRLLPDITADGFCPGSAQPITQ
jgi:hypothetical protein